VYIINVNLMYYLLHSHHHSKQDTNGMYDIVKDHAFR